MALTWVVMSGETAYPQAGDDVSANSNILNPYGMKFLVLSNRKWHKQYSKFNIETNIIPVALAYIFFYNQGQNRSLALRLSLPGHTLFGAAKSNVCTYYHAMGAAVMVVSDRKERNKPNKKIFRNPPRQ